MFTKVDEFRADIHIIVFWVMTLYNLIDRINVSKENAASIFRPSTFSLLRTQPHRTGAA
jgi:hypothetical protein